MSPWQPNNNIQGGWQPVLNRMRRKWNLPVLKISGDANISYVGNETVVTWLGDGTWESERDLDIDFLVVGGGGAGAVTGNFSAGGGGAGGLIEGQDTLQAGSGNIVVGDGGIGPDTGLDNPSENGGNSSFLTYTAIGGGGAGGPGGAEGVGSRDGENGGSGGGGGSNSGSGIGGSGTIDQGNDGGSGFEGSSGTTSAGGGGGGAGSVGLNASSNQGGNGGDGIASTITGTSTYYAGGGGGNAQQGTRGLGGLGGGGNGGDLTDAHANGVDGLGGGGGAATVNHPTTTKAGDGGSGTVIIRGRFDVTPRWQPENSDMWFAGDFESTIFQDENGTILASDQGQVGRWEDIKGTAIADARQGSSLLQPTYVEETNAVRFDTNTLESLNIDVTRNVGSFSVMAVVTPTTDIDHYGIVWVSSIGPNDSARVLLRRSNGVWGFGGRRLDGDAYVEVSGGSVNLGEKTAILGVFDYENTRAELWINGALVDVNTSFHTAGLTSDTASNSVGIGNTPGELFGGSFDGDIFEFAAKDEVPTEQEITEFFDHARDHWGVKLYDLDILASAQFVMDATTFTANDQDPVTQYDSNNISWTQNSTDAPIYIADDGGMPAFSLESNKYWNGPLDLVRNKPGYTVVSVQKIVETPSSGGTPLLYASTASGAQFTRMGLFMNSTTNWQAGGRSLDSESFQSIEGGSQDPPLWQMIAARFDYEGQLLNLWQGTTEIATSATFSTASLTSDTDSIDVNIGAVFGGAGGDRYHGGRLRYMIGFDEYVDDAQFMDLLRYVRDKYTERWEPELASSWYSADSYETTLFQDVAQTTPAITDTDTVRRWNSNVGPEPADARQIETGTAELRIIDDVPRIRVENGRPFNSTDLDVARNINGFTIFAIVEPLNGGTGHYGVVWGAYIDDVRDFRALLRRNAGEWNCGGRRFDADSFSSASGGTVTIGERTALVGTLDYVNGIVTVYQNGVQVAQNTGFHSGGPTEDTASLAVTIGSHLAISNIYNFRGDLYEIATKPEVASSLEITEFFNHARDFWNVNLD